jgi:hypothetical protein
LFRSWAKGRVAKDVEMAEKVTESVAQTEKGFVEGQSELKRKAGLPFKELPDCGGKVSFLLLDIVKSLTLCSKT